MKSSSNKRPATHAGSWYDDNPSALSKEIENRIDKLHEFIIESYKTLFELDDEHYHNLLGRLNEGL